MTHVDYMGYEKIGHGDITQFTFCFDKDQLIEVFRNDEVCVLKFIQPKNSILEAEYMLVIQDDFNDLYSYPVSTPSYLETEFSLGWNKRLDDLRDDTKTDIIKSMRVN